jgi:anti-sigma factor RsiW
MHLEERLITDYVDETIDAREQREVEQHLDACAECRRLVDDFREIRRLAGSLDVRQPPVRAWSRIERAIRFEQGEDARHAPAETAAEPTGRVVLFQRWRATMPWLAAAAVLVIATIVGVRYGVDRRGAPSSSAPAAPAAADAASTAAAAAAVEAELREAEAHYDRAIKGLEQIATSEQSALDPNTAATLQKNLAVIDQAISESRAAIRAQPASEPARESLLDSFKTKLALLQDTVALINEMRKGNEAGAARVVSGLKQKGD